MHACAHHVLDGEGGEESAQHRQPQREGEEVGRSDVSRAREGRLVAEGGRGYKVEEVGQCDVIRVVHVFGGIDVRCELCESAVQIRCVECLWEEWMGEV